MLSDLLFCSAHLHLMVEPNYPGYQLISSKKLVPRRWCLSEGNVCNPKSHIICFIKFMSRLKEDRGLMLIRTIAKIHIDSNIFEEKDIKCLQILEKANYICK